MSGVIQPDAAGHERIYSAVIWLTPLALFAPYAIAVYAGDLKLTPGKLLITALVAPAIASLLGSVASGQRRLLVADALAVAMAVWMIAVPIAVSGAGVTVGAGSQALEFVGSYVIGRTYLAGPGALRVFARALTMTLLIVFAFGVLDTATNRFLVDEALVSIFHPPGGVLDSSDPHFHRTVGGFDLLRATSTFDHPILYGAFCAIAVTILIFPASRLGMRWPILLIGLMGCLMSLSSASLIALAVSIAVFCYDRAVAWSGKWKLLAVAVLGGMVALSALSDSPVTWVIRHLTLDPQTGYFRLLMWDATGDYLAGHPIGGSGLLPTGNWLLDGSVDSVWLGKALNYGLPMVGFLLAIMATAIVPSAREAIVRRHHPTLDGLCTTYSLVLVLFCLIGLTAYLWNGMWLFWSLCMGIRVGLREHCLVLSAATGHPAPSCASPARSPARRLAPGRQDLA